MMISDRPTTVSQETDDQSASYGSFNNLQPTESNITKPQQTQPGLPTVEPTNTTSSNYTMTNGTSEFEWSKIVVGAGFSL